MAAIVLPRIIRSGGGSLAELPDALAQLGLRKPFIVTDAFLAGNGLVDSLLAILDGASLHHGLFTGTLADPTTAVIDAALAAMGDGDYDCVLGFGGGSPIDTA